MAWRFHEHIVRGELDNTVRGRVTGRIWLAGIAEPMTLDLRGDCAPDLAGCTLAFENPVPVLSGDSLPTLDQRGWVGDITASHKLKVFDDPPKETPVFIPVRKEAPSHWANVLYLEWFSERNGRIVIQSADFKLTLSSPVWTLTHGEYVAGREATGREYIGWLKQNFGPLTDEAQVANVRELLAGMDPDDETGWTTADDDAGEDLEPDFDPVEDAEWMPARDVLIKYGFTPLRPAEISAEHLRGRLWELIYALAGRRIYLRCTDHLDDRALYEWLDTFLDRKCPDCPLEAESNHHVDVSDLASGSDEGARLWLRFYATEQERSIWHNNLAGGPLPPRERPSHDRDRFLPEPPMPRSAWVPPPDENDEPPFDIADSAEADREIRIEKLKDEIAEATGGEMQETKSGDIPPATEEAYLEQVRDIERDGWQRPIDELSKHNAAPLPPDELTDEALTPRLWELLHSLACRGFYVQHTDHLSDHPESTRRVHSGVAAHYQIQCEARLQSCFASAPVRVGARGEKERLPHGKIDTWQAAMTICMRLPRFGGDCVGGGEKRIPTPSELRTENRSPVSRTAERDCIVHLRKAARPAKKPDPTIAAPSSAI